MGLFGKKSEALAEQERLKHEIKRNGIVFTGKMIAEIGKFLNEKLLNLFQELNMKRDERIIIGKYFIGNIKNDIPHSDSLRNLHHSFYLDNNNINDNNILQNDVDNNDNDNNKNDDLVQIHQQFPSLNENKNDLNESTDSFDFIQPIINDKLFCSCFGNQINCCFDQSDVSKMISFSDNGLHIIFSDFGWYAVDQKLIND